MISDDRFIRTTLPHWFFGQDDSGNLMSEENMLCLIDYCAQHLGQVHLVSFVMMMVMMMMMMMMMMMKTMTKVVVMVVMMMIIDN
jgi:hypothetical protein